MGGSGPRSESFSAADGPTKGGDTKSQENSLFNKHYNKELKLCEGK
jgi:hypothetical protein